MFRNIAGIFRNILKTAFRNTGLALLQTIVLRWARTQDVSVIINSAAYAQPRCQNVKLNTSHVAIFLSW